MAFTCSMTLNHTRVSSMIHGQDIQSNYTFHPLRQFLPKDKKAKQKQIVTLCVATNKNSGDKSTESIDNGGAPENSNSQTSQSAGSPSPFVGAKISSQIAARSRTADSTRQKQKEVSNAASKPPTSPQKTIPSSPYTQQTRTTASSPFNQQKPNPASPFNQQKPNPTSPFNQQKPNPTSPFNQKKPNPTSPFNQQKPTPTSPFSGSDGLKASKPSGLDTLRSSKPSVFLDTKQDFMKPGSKMLLDALKETDSDGRRTSNFSQPVVPTNLFDEPKKLPNDEKMFDFSLNTVQIVLIFSFLTIISVMLGTAFLVWKLGAIHYNEY